MALELYETKYFSRIRNFNDDSTVKFFRFSFKIFLLRNAKDKDFPTLRREATFLSASFRIWYEGHQDICSATHVGSSGAVEVNAAVKLCERSESIGFRYTTLLFDADSFLELKERNVHGSERHRLKKRRMYQPCKQKIENTFETDN
ncbi:uncharacterized protein TNCV_967041 [Trichonephila clavipes]|nr:uncharacterized protein TNCV_967041 [Trichonephila clavipes]